MRHLDVIECRVVELENESPNDFRDGEVHLRVSKATYELSA